MKRITSKPIDLRAFTCPQCDKMRMTRPLDHVVSKEVRSYKAKNGKDVELLIDVCDHCRAKNTRTFFEPSKADIRLVLKTMQEQAKLAEDQSLEDLL